MSATVKIIKGTYRNTAIRNTVFPLVRMPKQGAKGLYITVDGSHLMGPEKRAIRVKIDDDTAIEYDGVVNEVEAEPVINETDAEAMDRIRKRFAVLDTMTDAVTASIVRGLVISGPPGVGKSHGVETIINSYETVHRLQGGIGTATETVKGSVTPIALYKTLYDNRERGNIVVFDDCDSILFDEVCLNMLKAVLDTGKQRTLSWKAESRTLKEEGVPNRFSFDGGVIFITNLDFENVRSKKIADHLAAVMSRCHYIDLEMSTERDRFLRIEQIINDGMLDSYMFDDGGADEIVNFMKESSSRLREISLRMVIKMADLKKMSPKGWKELAESTCLKRLS